MRKILIVKLSAVGDVVHTIPCLMALREAFPEAHIGWVVEELSANLLEYHPAIDSLHVIPKKRWRKHFFRSFNSEIKPFIQDIRAKKYDTAIDFQGLTKSGLFAYLSGAKIRIGFGDKDGRELNKLFTNTKITPLENERHVIERNLSLLSALGISRPKINFSIPLTHEDRRYIGEWLTQYNVAHGFVILNPGAGWVTKRLPLQKFIELGERVSKELGREIVLTWGPGEEDVVSEIKMGIEKRGGIARVAPRTTFRQICALIEQSDAFVGGDTGPTHIAAAFDVPVVSFFGASDAKRNEPFCKKKVVIQADNIECVPCWKTKCRYPLISCLEKITVEDLFEGLKTVLKEP